jgi:hypothetical protein
MRGQRFRGGPNAGAASTGRRRAGAAPDARPCGPRRGPPPRAGRASPRHGRAQGRGGRSARAGPRGASHAGEFRRAWRGGASAAAAKRTAAAFRAFLARRRGPGSAARSRAPRAANAGARQGARTGRDSPDGRVRPPPLAHPCAPNGAGAPRQRFGAELQRPLRPPAAPAASAPAPHPQPGAPGPPPPAHARALPVCCPLPAPHGGEWAAALRCAAAGRRGGRGPRGRTAPSGGGLGPPPPPHTPAARRPPAPPQMLWDGYPRSGWVVSPSSPPLSSPPSHPSAGTGRRLYSSGAARPSRRGCRRAQSVLGVLPEAVLQPPRPRACAPARSPRPPSQRGAPTVGCSRRAQSAWSHKWSSSRCGSLPTTSSTLRPDR